MSEFMRGIEGSQLNKIIIKKSIHPNILNIQISSFHIFLECNSKEESFSSLETSLKAFMDSFQLEPFHLPDSPLYKNFIINEMIMSKILEKKDNI